MTLLKMSFSGTVLILVILVIRAAAVERLPKKTFLILWWAAFARLLIPFSVPSAFSAYSLVERIGIGQKEFYGISLSDFALSAVSGRDSQAGIQIQRKIQEGRDASIWVFLWAVGMLLCALFFMIVYLRCYREFRTSLPVYDTFARQWLEEHPLRRSVEIRQSERISSPLTYGIFRPVILVPKDIEWWEKTQLRYVLLHEYVHICRLDALAKLIAVAAVCIHWFNPFVWVLYVLFNRDIELTCDEAVVRRSGVSARSVYARVLIGMMEKKNGFTPFGNHFSRNAIEERITAIMRTKKMTMGAAVLSAAVLITTLTVFATSAREEQPEAEEAAGVERQTAESQSERQLQNMFAAGISYEDGKVCFMIPDGNESWDIQAGGRVEMEGFGGMSVHYLEEESESGNWENGKVYSFDVSGGGYTELFLNADVAGETVYIDLMGILPEKLKAESDSVGSGN